MSNFSLVANSTFQPFTYQELLAPVMDMSNYHQKIADEYDKLSSQADVLEAMGANDRDKGAYDRYKAYSDSLRMEADNLAMNGLDSESRQRLSELRRRYNTDIVPLQNAWNKREQEASDQMKARLANPSLMFTRDASATPIDDYVANPTGGYGVINGSNIATQMSNMAKNLAEQVRSGRRENVDPYTYRYIEKYGLDENIIRNWRNYPTLAAMYEQVMRSNGVTEDTLAGSLNADDIINKSTGYAEMGMWDAMGKTTTTFRDDRRALADLEVDTDRRKKANNGGDGAENITFSTPTFDYRNVRTSAEMDKYDEDKSAWDNYKQYFYKNSNGNWMMNSAGRDLYRRGSLYGKGGINTPEKKFRDFVDNIGATSMAEGKGGPNQTKALNSFTGKLKNTYDTNTATEYIKNIGATNYDNVIAALNKNAIDGVIPKYERVKKGDTYNYQEKGKKGVKVNELTTSDIKSAQLVYGSHGDFLEVKTKEGETILLPFSYLSNTYERVVEGNRNNIRSYNDRRAALHKNGIEALEVSPGRVVGTDDWMDNLITEELNNYGDNLLSVLGFDEIEPRKSKQGIYGTR